MAIVQFKTEPKCKICSSENRAEIERILEKRSRGWTDEAGVRMNLANALVKMQLLGINNPNAENIKAHWNKGPRAHAYWTDDSSPNDGHDKQEQSARQEEMDRRRAVVEAIIPGYLANPRALSPDEVAKLAQAIGFYEAVTKFAQGEKSGFTVDHGLKGGDLATKRKGNDAALELLEALGQGIEADEAEADELP